MKVHNLMEDIVAEAVNQVFAEEEQDRKRGFCTCYQCRTDVACYVLNRIEPQYMFSGRGLAHLKTDYQKNLQKMADLVGHINDGIKKVSAAKRPHFNHEGDHELAVPPGPLFNFPAIMGRIFNGTNFEPLTEIAVSLRSTGSLSAMINPNWQNPCIISEKTAGAYIFWPYPVQAAEERETRSFEFEVSTERTIFEEMRYFFTLELTSEQNFNDSILLQKSFELEDLYLFPR